MVSLVMELMELHNEVGAKYSDDLRLGWAGAPPPPGSAYSRVTHLSTSDWPKLGALEKGNFSQAQHPRYWDFKILQPRMALNPQKVINA